MCCVLLHVEKVRTLWLLCPAKPVWKKEVQQLSWCNVSFSCVHSDVKMNVRSLSSLGAVEADLCWCVFWPCRDLMDRLVDEAEGLVDSSGSVCSSSSGRIEGSADQQLNILNSITASDLSGEFMPPLSQRLGAPCHFFIETHCFITNHPWHTAFKLKPLN